MLLTCDYHRKLSNQEITVCLIVRTKNTRWLTPYFRFGRPYTLPLLIHNDTLSRYFIGGGGTPNESESNDNALILMK